MSPRKSGTIYLIQMVVTLGISLLLSVGSAFFSVPRIGIVLNSFLSQGAIILPAIIVFLFSRDSLKNVIMIRDVRFVTVFLFIPALLLLEPLTIACNALSMTVARNEVAALSPEILDRPSWLMFLLIAIIGPICEEITFRGFIYGGLRRSGRIIPAIFLQALLFGLMHGNLNQFCYATVIGVVLALAYEVTGSILSSIWLHMLINAPQVVLLYVFKDFAMRSGEITKTQPSPFGMLLTGIFFLVISLFTTTMLGFVIYGISLVEKRSFIWAEMFKNRDEDKGQVIPVWSIPCVIGCILAVVRIILALVSDHMA